MPGAWSCGGASRKYARRLVETAAHLADHVLPRLPVRQWVLAVPKRLRYFLHRAADLQGAALGEFLRVVEKQLRAHSPGSGPSARSVHSPLRVDAQCPPALPLRRNRRRVRLRRRGPGRLPPPGSMRTPSPTCKSACGAGCCASSCAAACWRGLTRGRWRNGNTAVASPWTARCASRPLTARGASVCCVTAPAGRLPWNGYASSMASASSTTTRNRGRRQWPADPDATGAARSIAALCPATATLVCWAFHSPQRVGLARRKRRGGMRGLRLRYVAPRACRRSVVSRDLRTSAYVPKVPRRGVGRALYFALFDALRAGGYCGACAGIALPNDASIALHRNVGFEPVGVFRAVGRKFDAWHDVS